MVELAIALMAHSPGMTGFPERAGPEAAARVFGAVEELRRRVARFDPEVVVAVSNDHFTATTMAALPPFAVATGHRFANPASPKMAEFLAVPPRTTPGHGALARHLIEALGQRDVDVTQLGGRFRFDENYAVPLHLLDLAATPTVPFVVNAVEHPMPTLARCRAVGTHLGQVLRAQRMVHRILVLGTGGLSHSVGVARAGEIDEDFDRRFLDDLAAGRLDDVAGLDPAVVTAAGNGTEEVRQWLLAASAAAPGRVEVLHYEPVPAWLTGVAIAGSPAS